MSDKGQKSIEGYLLLLLLGAVGVTAAWKEAGGGKKYFVSFTQGSECLVAEALPLQGKTFQRIPTEEEHRSDPETLPTMTPSSVWVHNQGVDYRLAISGALIGFASAGVWFARRG